MPYQAPRGNPEQKQYFVVNNFVGGMNTLSADDVISTIESRELLNMNIAGSGMAEKRKGFKYAEILNTWLSQVAPTGIPGSDVFFIRVIKNEGNVSQIIEDFEVQETETKWSDFVNSIKTRQYNFHLLVGYSDGVVDDLGKRQIKVDLIKFVNNADVSIVTGGLLETDTFLTEINTVPDGDDFTDTVTDVLDGGVFFTGSSIENVATFTNVKPKSPLLTNIDIVSYLGKHFILLNQLSEDLNGLLQIDEVEYNTYAYSVINSTNTDNLYKPTPGDIDPTNNIGGYNMLYEEPQNQVYNNTAIREIYGLYVTSPVADRVYEDYSVPSDGHFTLNVIFSGAAVTVNDFEIEVFEENSFGDRVYLGYTVESSSINGALAKFTLQLDSASLEGTILINVSLAKEANLIVPEKTFDTYETLLLRYGGLDKFVVASSIPLSTNKAHPIYTIYDSTRQNLLYAYRKLEVGAEPIYVSKFYNTQVGSLERVSWNVSAVVYGSEGTDYDGKYQLRDGGVLYQVAALDRSWQSATFTEYNDSLYKVNLDLESTSDPLTLLDGWQKGYARHDTVFRVRVGTFLGNGDFSPTTVNYYKVGNNDTIIGTLVPDKTYLTQDDITSDTVVQVPSYDTITPSGTASIFEIDDAENTSDDVVYYRYNGGTTKTATDFDFYVAEDDTSVEETVEIPVLDSEEGTIDKLEFSGARILEIDGRLVAYQGATIWFSDYRRFNYFPSNMYFNLALATDDEITSINYFRGSYIVFTRKMIWKMTGNVDIGDVSFQILNDSIGCIAPRSVQPFNNTLVFMTRDGLYRIKQNFYLDGLENVEKIDKRIPGVLPAVSDYESSLYNEQYLLFIRKEGFQYSTLRYYYNVQIGRSESPYVVDKYAQNPDHLFKVEGTLYGLKDGWLYQYDQGYTDFLPTVYTEQDLEDAIYRTRIQLPNFSFGYPTHEKKYKNLFMKTVTDQSTPLYITIKIDGYEFASPYNFKVYRDADGIIQYEYTLDLQTAALGSFVVGEHTLGSTDVNQHKVTVGGKGKNITLILEQESNSYFGVTNIGYLFKLGKVRGDL